MCVYRLVSLLFIILSLNTFADGEFYKNSLNGGRAATMGGAYIGISDDSSGAYYNPAGLVYANGDSISGSANTYTLSKATYEQTIGNKDWERESKNLMPNFFGMVKKSGDSTYAFSYVVTDSFIEHQDQIHRGIYEVNPAINVYVQNIHSEDNTYNIGPSYSKKLSNDLSFGTTLYYHYRVFRREQFQLLKFADGTDESTYLNTTKKEKGVRPKIGLMWTPKENYSIGLTAAHTFLYDAYTDNQNSLKAKGSAITQFAAESTTDKRPTPYELSIGGAFFSSPYVVFSSDIDYYLPNTGSKNQVVNVAVGGEFFLNETNAIRTGLYTNRSSSKKPSGSTVAPLEHIDYYGATAGYAIYTKASSITFGTIYSYGKGDAQIYENSSAMKDFSRYSLSFIMAADYGF